MTKVQTSVGSAAASTASASGSAASTGVDNTANVSPVFSTDEILWYDNGRWGEAGYAIPNPAGKTATMNMVIAEFTSTVGKMLFDLAHREDARFEKPPTSQFMYDLYTCMNLARTRLVNQTKADNDPTGLTVGKAAPNYRPFLVWPVPFFGERVRQTAVRQYIEIALLMLQEAMQHSDNDRPSYITQDFQTRIGKYVTEIIAQMAMKFFGYTRAQAYAANFAFATADWTSYNPAAFLMSCELSSERPPLYWWPTVNDLDAIAGIPIQDALAMGDKWPATPTMYVGATSVGVSLAGSPAPLAGGGSTPSAQQSTNNPSTVASFATPASQVPSAATTSTATPAAASSAAAAGS